MALGRERRDGFGFGGVAGYERARADTYENIASLPREVIADLVPGLDLAVALEQTAPSSVTVVQRDAPGARGCA